LGTPEPEGRTGAGWHPKNNWKGQISFEISVPLGRVNAKGGNAKGRRAIG